MIEIAKFFPELKVFQQACPLWVPLVENNEHEGAGADYFVKKYLDALLLQSPNIDTIVLGCTHYPLLINKIRTCLPASVQVIAQGEIVAKSLVDYLQRHPEMEAVCSKHGQIAYFTTESAMAFDEKAAIFMGEAVASKHLGL